MVPELTYRLIMEKRILYIAHRIPYPPNKGDKIRSYHELEYLSRHYTVDLVTFIDDPFDRKYIPNLKKYTASAQVYSIYKPWAILKGMAFLLVGKSLSQGWYASARVQRYIDKLLDRHSYAFAVCFSSQVGQFLMNRQVTKIIDFCDADSDKFRQYSENSTFPHRQLYWLEWKRLKKWEHQVYQAFDHSLIVTQAEAHLFSEGKKLPKLHVMTNGMDTHFFSPLALPKEKYLVFSGDMAYQANIDGAVWFCHGVLPLILKKEPDFKFYIVGRNPGPELVKLGNKNPAIILTGTVKDIRPYLARSLGAVVPLRIARGIQNKVLEAMAMGIPVLIPRILLISLDGVQEGQEVLAFQGEEECAEVCLKVLRPNKEVEVMAQAGCDFVRAQFQWEKNLQWFSEIVAP